MPKGYALIFISPIISSSQRFAKAVFSVNSVLEQDTRELELSDDILLKMRLSGVAKRLIWKMSA